MTQSFSVLDLFSRTHFQSFSVLDLFSRPCGGIRFPSLVVFGCRGAVIFWIGMILREVSEQ